MAGFAIDSFTVPCQYVREYSGATRTGKDCELLLSVKKYTPIPKPGGGPARSFSILAAGGNGFPKELYEPLWDDLLRSTRDAGLDINAIWMADMAHQGASGRLNEEKLGDDPSWFDNARDLLQVVNYFRKEMKRPIVGIGHSVGATALINLAAFHPRLFSNLVLIEPILGNLRHVGLCLAKHAAEKPKSWCTRVEAEAFFSRTRPFSAWDARVLGCWLQHGIMPVSDSGSGMVLVTSKHQEAITYLRPLEDQAASRCDASQLGSRSSRYSTNERSIVKAADSMALPLDAIVEIDTGYYFYAPAAMITLDKLPQLRPRVLYLFGAKSVMSPTQMQQQLVSDTGTGIGGNGGQRQNKVRSIVVEASGHLVPFEAPQRCADIVTEELSLCLGTIDERPTWRSLDPRTREVTKEWRDAIEQDLGQSKRKSSKI